MDLGDPGPGQALIRTTLTTICGSDIHLVDEFPEIPAGTPMGHEAIGVVEAVGDGVERLQPGQRVASACLTSCGHCRRCRQGEYQVCSEHGAPFNLLFGAQGEAFLLNGADFSATVVPEALDDRHALLATDILSTGFGAVERGGVKPGDSVAVFAQGPVGLCCTIAAAYYGAEPLIAVESIPERVELAKRFGATHVFTPENAVSEILRLTDQAGVDVAVEALGKQITFENCCRVTRFGGTVSSVGVYGGIPSLSMPTDGTFQHRSFVSTLCPTGVGRLDFLLGLIESGKVDPTPMLTHTMTREELPEAYRRFRTHSDGIVKLTIR